MKRLTTVVCSAVLAVGALAGCGSDDSGSGDSDNASGGGGDYCGQVEDVQKDITSMGADATLGDLKGQVESMNAVSDSAPEDVSSSWSKLADASDSMATALEDAGVKEDEKLQEAMQSNKKAAQSLAKVGQETGNLEKDSKAISDQVKKECDIDLAGGGSEGGSSQ